MRRLGYGLLALLVLLALLPLALSGWRQWEAWRNLAPARNAGLDERVLFEPVGDAPLAFNVSTHQGWFALQGFAVASPQARAAGVRVTLEVVLAGARGSERMRRYLALAPSRRARPYGLLDGRGDRAVWVLPTEWLDLSSRPDVRAVSVRVLDVDEGTRAVLWRGAIDKRLPDAQVRLRYQRLSDPARESLTDGWVTPASLVSPAVKQELLRYRAERVAPLGRPGEAFAARRVLRNAADGVARRYDPRPLALAIAPTLRVALDLDEAHEVIVDARQPGGRPLALAVDGPSLAGGRIEGRWQGHWAPGRYELRSADIGDVDVRDAATGDALLPSGLRPRTHRALPARPLRYRLHALDEAPPPVRLRLRAEGRDARAEVRFVDAGGAVLDLRRLDVPMRPSLYDRPAAASDRAASDAVQVDLQPPPAAVGLVVASDAPLLAHAATTLPGTARRWFAFQPEGDPRSALSQGVVILEQPRPDESRATSRIEPMAPATAARTRVAARDAPPRPTARRLRLRPERPQDAEDVDAD